jgi:hypothetical protein
MINYLEKYNNLPKDLRDKISAPRVMEAIHDMEDRYTVNLAALVMRVVVKDIKVKELHNFFVYNIGISADKASALVAELKEKVFSEIGNYIDYISGEDELNDDYAGAGLKFESEQGAEMADDEGAETDENKTGAGFYFSIEDEDEVRRQAKDFGSLDKRRQIAEQVEGKIADIIGQINIIFSSEEMLHRLKQVLKTYLRGVRDKIDTKLVLEREIENGGLGLDEEISDDILKIVDIINKEEALHPGRAYKSKRFLLPEDRNGANGSSALGGDVAYDFSRLAKSGPRTGQDASLKEDKEISTVFESDGLSAEDTDIEESPLDRRLARADQNAAIAAGKKLEEKEAMNKIQENLVLDLSRRDREIIEQKENESRRISASNDNSSSREDAFANGAVAKARAMSPAQPKSDAVRPGEVSGKVKMEDIKKMPKYSGPLDEVGSMGLVDFRRISKDPEVAIGKIKEKFDLLEEEGFNKRLEGVKAWRQSPINKLYLSIGQESLINKKDITQIIESRKNEGRDYLSQAEFNAIMGLNKSLRY